MTSGGRAQAATGCRKAACPHRGVLLAGFIKLGRAFGNKGRPEIGAALDKWSTTFSDFMPSNERVQQLAFEESVRRYDSHRHGTRARSSGCGTQDPPPRRAQVLDLSEFMAVYEAPIDMQMRSAIVWPADKPLLY